MVSRKIGIIKERVKTALRLRKETITSMCDGTMLEYETIRKGLADGYVMPDHLKQIEEYLNVTADYLQGKSPKWYEYCLHYSDAVKEEIMNDFDTYVDDSGILMKEPSKAIEEARRHQRGEDVKTIIRDYTALCGYSLPLDEMDINYLNTAFYQVLEGYKKVREDQDRICIFNPDNSPLWTNFKEISKGKEK